MAAITWRNVDAPSLGDPGRSLLAAQQGMNQSFQSLGDILKDYTAQRDKNWDVTKANKTEDIYARVASQFPTPEAFKAALASGQIDQMVAATGGQVDRAGIRQYLDNRMGKLITDASALQAFNDDAEKRAVMPLLQEAKVRAANGDKVGVLDLVKSNPNLAKWYGGDLAAAGVMGERQLAEFGWKGAEAGRAAEKFPEELKQMQATTKAALMNADSQRISANASATQASAAVQNARTNATEAELRGEQIRGTIQDRLLQRAGDLRTQLQSLDKSASTDAGSKIIDDAINSVKDERTKANLYAANKAIKQVPELANLPANIVKDILLGDQDSSWSWARAVSNSSGKTAVESLKEMVQTPAFKEYLGNNQAQRQSIQAAMEGVKTQLKATGFIMPDLPPAAARLSQAAAAAAPATQNQPTVAEWFKKTINGGDTAVAAEATPVALPEAAKTGNANLDGRLAEVIRQRAAQAYPGVQVKNGVIDISKLNPDTLTTWRNQVAAELKAEKKSPGITDPAAAPAAAPVKTPLLTDPAKVKETVGLSLNTSGSGTTLQPAEPVVIPKDVKWGEKQTVVEAKPAAQIKNTGQKVVLSFVQDGDTATFKQGNGSSINCRIDSIDAPEAAHQKYGKAGQPYGEESKKTLEQLVANKEVSIRVVKASDKYGRSLCQIEVEGKDVGLEMARVGAAWAYKNFGVPVNPAVSQAADEARKNRVGLWANPNAVDPRNFK